VKIRKIGVMCGERWYSFNSWRAYPLFWIARPEEVEGSVGFGIGPILFWDGS
jgi:hypothetical protein